MKLGEPGLLKNHQGQRSKSKTAVGAAANARIGFGRSPKSTKDTGTRNVESCSICGTRTPSVSWPPCTPLWTRIVHLSSAGWVVQPQRQRAGHTRCPVSRKHL